MLAMDYAATFRVTLALKSHGAAALGRSLLRNPFAQRVGGYKSIRHPYKKINGDVSFIAYRPYIPSIVMSGTNGSCH